MLHIFSSHLLPSDPAVTSNALAIRIVFPLVGMTPAYRRLGLPAMPGKQKFNFSFLPFKNSIISLNSI
jgi:hypothetical protein